MTLMSHYAMEEIMNESEAKNLEFVILDTEYKIFESIVELQATIKNLRQLKENLPKFPEMKN